MKNVLKIALSMTCLYLAACGGSGGDSKKNLFTFDNEDDATRIFNSSTLNCKDNSCPEYAAGLTTYSDLGDTYEVGVCTATLVGADRLLTNKHCIPKDLQKAGAACGKRIKLKFPTIANKPAENIDCAEIVDMSIYATGGSALHPDWALIRTKISSSRTPVALDTEGIDNGKSVHLYPIFYEMKHGSKNIVVNGEMRLMQCKTDRWAHSAVMYFHKFSALFGIDQCSENVISGNSGTGLLSEANKLIGVGSFGMPDGVHDKEFGGTNLACIERFNNPVSPFCAFPSEDTGEFLVDVNLIKLYSALNQDSYFIVSRDNFVTAPDVRLIREGSGVQLNNFVANTDGENVFRMTDETMLSYMHVQLSSFAFKNTAGCVEAGAPDQFSTELPVYNVKFDNFALMGVSAAIPVNQSNILFRFSTEGDHYLAHVEMQPLEIEWQRKINSLVPAETWCSLQKENLVSDNLNCFQAERLIADFGMVNTEKSQALRTNLFLKRSYAKTITLEIPRCK